MSQPISEGELIEIERRMRKIEAYLADNLHSRNGREPRLIEVCKYGEAQFDDVMADLRRLIAQARESNFTGITESSSVQRQGIANI